MQIIFGMPKSGKSYFVNAEYGNDPRSYIIKHNEHDTRNISLTLTNTYFDQTNDELYETVREASVKYNTVVIDSISMLALSGDSLRQGGINNNLAIEINKFLYLEMTVNTRIIATLSPFSLDLDYAISILHLILGTTRDIKILSLTHKVLDLSTHDYNVNEIKIHLIH